MDAQAFGVLVQVVVLIVIAAAVAAFQWRKRVRARRESDGTRLGLGLRSRLIMFGAGAIVQLGFIYLNSTSVNFGAEWFTESLVRAGIVWVILLEIIYRTRRLTSSTLPAYVLLTWLIETPFYVALVFAGEVVRGQNLDRLIEIYSSPIRWLPHLFPVKYVFYDVAEAALLVGASYLLVRGSPSFGMEDDSTNSSWAGYGGIEMTSAKSHTTRFLCASAFLLGTSYRHKVLDYLDDENRAAAPEPGVDLELVAQVCRFAEKQALKYYLLFPAIVVAGLVLAVISPILLVVPMLALVLLYFYKESHARSVCASAFGRDEFDPIDVKKRFPAELKEEILGGLPSPDQNLIVYSQFKPFVGAGISLGGWSFAVNVQKPKEDSGQHSLPVRFPVTELYSELEQTIVGAGLEGIAVNDMFFVHGSDIRNDKALLPSAFGRPLQHLNVERANSYINGSDSRVRHYKWVRVHDWGNELVTSYLLRCSLRGNNLFVEINRYLLTPLQQRYRRIDRMAKRGWRDVFGLAIASLIIAPFYPWFCLFVLFGKLLHGMQNFLGGKHRGRRREINENPLFNYGSAAGLRESFSSDQFVHYFQKLDGDFYSKVLEREILDAIVTFLDEHNIDTSELKERQSTILNSGIIIHGGDVKAESLAVGAGAQAVKMPVPPAKPSKRFKQAAQGAA